MIQDQKTSIILTLTAHLAELCRCIDNIGKHPNDVMEINKAKSKALEAVRDSTFLIAKDRL